jgi:hypothetical protein
MGEKAGGVCSSPEKGWILFVGLQRDEGIPVDWGFKFRLSYKLRSTGRYKARMTRDISIPRNTSNDYIPTPLWPPLLHPVPRPANVEESLLLPSRSLKLPHHAQRNLRHGRHSSIPLFLPPSPQDGDLGEGMSVMLPVPISFPMTAG